MALIRINKDVLKRYNDPRACCQVLGCLMLNPKLVKSRQYPIHSEYFATRNHRILFEVIEALAENGANQITLSDIETWMAQNASLAYKRFFEMSDESDWILALIEDANLSNYEYYFNVVRKYSYLRDKLDSGQDVSDILDESEIDTALLEQQREKFLRTPLQDIIKYFDKKNIDIKQKYSLKSDEDVRKSGDNIDELLESFKLAPELGWRSESQYLDNATRGCRRGMFVVESKDSGTGKSRMGVRQLCTLSCDTLWNHMTKQFEPNPYGSTIPTLYIGTEMDLYKEIEPIIIATISGVEEDKIRTWNLTRDEEERVRKGAEISKRSPIYLQNEPNYDCAYFWNTVEEYVTDYNIGALIVDYIETTPNLAGEYSQMVKGMNVKEDQVLFNLSTQLKNIAKMFDIFIKAYTQISDNARRDYHIRDSGAIKGCKSLQMRADLAMCTFRPSKEEMEFVQSFLDDHPDMPVPNIVMHVYKNRGGKFVMFKVWCWQDLGNMEFVDVFVTDWNYKVMDKMKKVQLHCHEVELQNDTGVEQVALVEEDLRYNPETGEIEEEVETHKRPRLSRRR